MELAVKQRLPVDYQRAANLDHHLMPLAAVQVRPPELVGNPGSAHYRQFFVDQQQFAVVAVEVSKAATPMHPVIETQDHARIGQALAQADRESRRAEAIEQTPHDNPATCRTHQRLHDRFGTGAGFNQIQLELDLLLRAFDRGDHARKKSRAVDQQVELVFLAPREDRAPHGRLAMAVSRQV